MYFVTPAEFGTNPGMLRWPKKDGAYGLNRTLLAYMRERPSSLVINSVKCISRLQLSKESISLDTVSATDHVSVSQRYMGRIHVL